MLGPVLAAALMVGLALPASASTLDPLIPSQAAVVAARAQQVLDDAVYLPVTVNGHWALFGRARTWLQPTMSTTSTPWRWVYPCARLDPKLVPGMRAYETSEIRSTFSGELALSLLTRFSQHLARVTDPKCSSLSPGVAQGPPGPIIDQFVAQSGSGQGGDAVVRGQAKVTDWQSGVSHKPAPEGGRFLGWRKVPGLLDVSYTLHKDLDGRWRVAALTANFAPGHEP